MRPLAFVFLTGWFGLRAPACDVMRAVSTISTRVCSLYTPRAALMWPLAPGHNNCQWPPLYGQGQWPQAHGHSVWPRSVTTGHWTQCMAKVSDHRPLDTAYGQGQWPQAPGHSVWPRSVTTGPWTQRMAKVSDHRPLDTAYGQGQWPQAPGHSVWPRSVTTGPWTQCMAKVSDHKPLDTAYGQGHSSITTNYHGKGRHSRIRAYGGLNCNGIANKATSIITWRGDRLSLIFLWLAVNSRTPPPYACETSLYKDFYIDGRMPWSQCLTYGIEIILFRLQAML